jgi:hypothetical protein
MAASPTARRTAFSKIGATVTFANTDSLSSSFKSPDSTLKKSVRIMDEPLFASLSSISSSSGIGSSRFDEKESTMVIKTNHQLVRTVEIAQDRERGELVGAIQASQVQKDLLASIALSQSQLYHQMVWQL